MHGLQYYIAVFLVFAFICRCGALRCRTDDGPTTEEIKRVVRICMQRTNEHYPDGQQHHRDRDNKNKNDNYDEGDYKGDDDDDSASDDSNSNESSASTSNRNSDQQNSHSHHNNQRRDSSDNAQYPRDYHQQSQKYDNYGGGDMNNRRDYRQQQQNSPTRHYDPYGGGQQEQQQQRDTDGYARGYNNNNYPNDNRYGGNEYSMRRVRDAESRRRSSVHTAAQWQLHDNQTTGHRMFNMQDNKQTHHGMMGNSNGSTGNENQTQQHQQQGSCMVQCFFQELKMTNRDGLPDKHKMLTVMTKDVRDAQLKDFYVDSIQECHRILEMDYVYEKCTFARNLVSCLSERARANCEDFRESMLF